MIRFISSLALLLLVSAAPLWTADAPLNAATMMPNEWTEYRYERHALIQGNPDLAAEDKALAETMDAQEERVATAMVKTDPQVAPLLTRLTALVQSNWAAAPDAPTLSAEEWQKIRSARAAALAASPGLAAANQDLLVRKKAFDAKVDAALIKADPGLAPFVASLKAQDRP